MAKKIYRPIVDSKASEKISQFRQELDQQLETAIEHHEFKMVYIGIATLIAFAATIYAAWKF